MLSILPDLSPRDCQSLWCSSPRNRSRLAPNLDPAINPLENSSQQQQHALGMGPSARNRAAHAIERSALGRLRTAEIQAERRRMNIRNIGINYLKPPGVPKTLFQLHEERREALEHAEAVRREELQQQLAEIQGAAAAAAAAAAAGGEGAAGPAAGAGQDEDLVMGEEDAVMGRDLDEEIPDADDAGGFGYDGASENQSETDEEDDGEYESDEEGGGETVGTHGAASTQPSGREALATVRETEDRVREMVARAAEGNDGGVFYGEEEELTEEGHANLLEEEDLAHDNQRETEGDVDLDMDADLDADIPEAGYVGGYEHTDSDASVSADDEGRPSIGHVGRAPQASRNRASISQGNETRISVDISGLLSQDGSSMLGSSPQMRRRG